MAIAIIPARGGSKGILKKNLSQVNGKNLVQRSVETAIQTGRFREIYLDTDDYEIAHVGQDSGATVPFLRPPHLATDDAGIIDCLKHFCSKLGLDLDSSREPIALLQPTNPLRTSREVVTCLDAWEKHEGSCSVTLVAEPLQNIKDLILVKSDGSCQQVAGVDFSVTNRQVMPPIKFISGSIYVFSLNFLNLHGMLITERNTVFVETDQQTSIDIDSDFDLHLARLLSKNPFHS